MCSIIRQAIKEYLLGYYMKYEKTECMLSYENGYPYITCKYGLYTVETSLMLYKEFALIVQNILRVWGLDVKYNNNTGQGEFNYCITTQNDKVINMILSPKRRINRQSIYAINGLLMYNDIGSLFIKGQLLTLLIEPLLFFEIYEDKCRYDTFFDAYKFGINSTIHNHACKYWILKQLAINKQVIVWDVLHIVLDVYVCVVSSMIKTNLVNLL